MFRCKDEGKFILRWDEEWVGNEKMVRVNTDHSFKERSAMKAYRARAKGMLGAKGVVSIERIFFNMRNLNLF